MNVTIQSIDKKLFSGDALEVNLPGIFGNVGIKSHHAPMSLALREGEIIVTVGNTQENFPVKSGIAYVQHNRLNIMLNA